MPVTPTELRADLYRLLDAIVASGEPLLVRRGDVTLRIAVAARGGDQPAVLPALRHDLIVGDPNDLVHMDWTGAWTAGEDL